MPSHGKSSPISSSHTYSDMLVLQIFDSADCRGRNTTYDNLFRLPGACSNATFELDKGLHSGRSAKLVCRKPKPIAKPVPTRMSTLVPIPVIVQTEYEPTTMTVTKSQEPSTFHSIIIPAVKTLTSTVTSSSAAAAKTVLHIAHPKTSTRTIMVSQSSSPTTTKVFCFSTAFKDQKAQPTRRSEVEVGLNAICL